MISSMAMADEQDIVFYPADEAATIADVTQCEYQRPALDQIGEIFRCSDDLTEFEVSLQFGSSPDLVLGSAVLTNAKPNANPDHTVYPNIFAIAEPSEIVRQDHKEGDQFKIFLQRDVKLGEIVLPTGITFVGDGVTGNEIIPVHLEAFGDITRQYVFSLKQNGACTVSVSEFELIEKQGALFQLDFNCSTVEVNLPFQAEAAECQTNASNTLCIVAPGQKNITFTSDTWLPFDVTLEDTNAVALPIFISPKIHDLDLSKFAFEHCAMESFTFETGDVCTTDQTASCAVASHNIALAELGEVVPSFVEIDIFEDGLIRDTVTVPMSYGPADVESRLQQWIIGQNLPLPVEISDDFRVNTRSQLAIYANANCAGPETAAFSLADLVSAPVASGPTCGSARVVEGTSVLTECRQLTASTGLDSLLPIEIEPPCAPQKTLVLFIQNSTLNGEAGTAIIEAAQAAISRQSADTTCAAVDYATTQSERRIVLATAEDLFHNANTPDDITSMAFASTNSEVLRDFRWVWRNYGDRLSGLIIVGDSQHVVASDLTTSAEALAWHILGVKAEFLDLGNGVNCDAIVDYLKFDRCESVNISNIKDALLQSITNRAR